MQEPKPRAVPEPINHDRLESAVACAGRFMQARRDVASWQHKDVHMEDRYTSFIMLVVRTDGSSGYETVRVSPDGTAARIRR